jgi:hypothetical protein
MLCHFPQYLSCHRAPITMTNDRLQSPFGMVAATLGAVAGYALARYASLM